MIKFEVSNCEPEGKIFFSRNILTGMLTKNASRKAGADHLMLESREERIALLKTGFSGKDIESLYLKLNGIIVIDVNWKD